MSHASSNIYNSQTIPGRFLSTVNKFPNNNAQYIKGTDGVFYPRTYQELKDEVLRSAVFFQNVCKIKKGDKISLISDNSEKWLVLDLAILSLGAIDVPRGSDTIINEIAYITQHAECSGAIFEHFSVFESFYIAEKKTIEKLSFVMIINPPKQSHDESFQKYKKHLNKKNIGVYHYQSIHNNECTNKDKETIIRKIEKNNPNDIATIIYTSGTTDIPKGACLSHKGFLFQTDAIVPKVVHVAQHHMLLTVLPVWHAYERAIQYVVIITGSCLAYSKPIGKILLADIVATNAQWMTSVPRIWEGVYAAIHRKIKNSSVIKRLIFALATTVGKHHAIATHKIRGTFTDYTSKNEKQKNKALVFLSALPLYFLLMPLRVMFDFIVFKKIRALLGKNFIGGISGGGALPSYVDWFFQAANILLIEGYGLTEASPVLSIRSQKRPEANSLGKILDGVEYKVLNSAGTQLSYGEKGVLYVRSPHIMKGYYKNEKSTAEILDEDGWLNTGDLVVIAKNGNVKIEGRKKETIVLRSGENVEPAHVENIFLQSDYISHIMAVGQDQKYVAALITPELEEIQTALSISRFTTLKDISIMPEVIALIKTVIDKYNQHLPLSSRIVKFSLISEAFEIGEELTQTLKLKRSVIAKKYESIIASMYQL